MKAKRHWRGIKPVGDPKVVLVDGALTSIARAAARWSRRRGRSVCGFWQRIVSGSILHLGDLPQSVVLVHIDLHVVSFVLVGRQYIEYSCAKIEQRRDAFLLRALHVGC